MKNFWKPLVVFGCAILVSSCGSGGGDSDQPSGDQPGQVPIDFAGRYEGTEQGTEGGVPFDTTLTATLAQSGNQVTGNYATGLGGSGSIDCTASGNSLTCTVDPGSACPSSGTATLNGNRLTGRVTRAESNECSALDGTLDLTRRTSSPPPPPPPVSSEPDWETVGITVTNAVVTQFQFDDDGNYSGSGGGSSGTMAVSDLQRLDSRIDAVKEEAHDPFVCASTPFLEVDVRIRLTFANRSPAIVYQTDKANNEECWSGDRIAVLELSSELGILGNKYVFP